jgi:protoheme IX farnesyltransferase
MLPVTHGEAYTRLNILLYTILLVLVTLLPYLISMSGVIYLLTAIVLDVFFLYYAIRMYLVPDDLELPMKMFRFSISYLGFLFAALLIDHYLLFQLSV